MRKVNEQVLHKVAEAVSRDVEIPLDSFITVTGVQTSRDLRHAKVNVMVIPDGKRITTMKKLNAQKGQVQKALASALKMKFTPKIHFELDDLGIRAQHMYDVLDVSVREKEESGIMDDESDETESADLEE